MKISLLRFGILVCLFVSILSTSAGAQEPEFAPPAVTSEDLASDGLVAPSAEALSLEAIIRNGGSILWAIMILGFFTMILAFYLLATITSGREVPAKMLKRIANQVRAGEFYEATKLCDGRPELMARVLYSGLRVSEQERYIIQEAMESEGERGAAQLWQRISYLNNVGAIAPLLGLLGTVWGMINAFSAIALDNSQVKGLTMAYSVSQAMITTAAGLLLAIPALLTYFFLRGRVLKVIALVESQASEFVELIVRHQKES